MTLRASDAEATAIGTAAAAGAAFATHIKECLACKRAKDARKLDQSCPEGLEMVLTVQKSNKLIDRIREDKRKRLKLQAKLF